jgi:small subunit ribosomal protein S2
MRNIKDIPGVLIVIDSNFEEIAVFEARKLGIPIVGIVDTNANPEGISYPVPGNDDAIRSIKLFTTKFGEAVRLGMERRLSDSLNQEARAEQEEAEAARAAETQEAVVDAVDVAEVVDDEEIVDEVDVEQPEASAADQNTVDDEDVDNGSIEENTDNDEEDVK